MANVMLATYPELFSAGAIIAGLPYGSAGNVHEAFSAMAHQRDASDHISAIAFDVRRAITPTRGPGFRYGTATAIHLSRHQLATHRPSMRMFTALPLRCHRNQNAEASCVESRGWRGAGRTGKPTDNDAPKLNSRLRAECLNTHWFLTFSAPGQKAGAVGEAYIGAIRKKPHERSQSPGRYQPTRPLDVENFGLRSGSAGAVQKTLDSPDRWGSRAVHTSRPTRIALGFGYAASGASRCR
jgi:hypothetical protein